jgi:hypothetical protein
VEKMSTVAQFLFGVGLTLVASALVVAYLQRRLQPILFDLCGTAERASFWMAFSNVTLLLVPLIFALHYRPENAGTSIVFTISGQLELALIGLVGSVVLLGLVLNRFISRQQLLIPPSHNARSGT